MRATVFAALMLVACAPQGNGSDDLPPPETTCGADKLQHLIGLPYEPRDFEAEGRPLRILPPGSMMTMDHRPNRLNVELDQNSDITRIWCG